MPRESLDLIHCVYASLASEHFKEYEIPSLLERARAANAARDITGMLLFIDGNFFQVLEGPAMHVDAVYEVISKDERHLRVTQIIREPISHRRFSEWTMGFSRLERQDAEAMLGENDFFSTADCLARLDGGRAKKLLQAFRKGRWRLERTGTYRALG